MTSAGTFSPAAAGSRETGARVLWLAGWMRPAFVAFAAVVVVVDGSTRNVPAAVIALAGVGLCSLSGLVGPVRESPWTRAVPVIEIALASLLVWSAPEARDQTWVLYLPALLLAAFLYPSVLALATGAVAGVASVLAGHPSDPTHVDAAVGFAFPALALLVALVAGSLNRQRTADREEVERLRTQSERMTRAFGRLAAGDLSDTAGFEVVPDLGHLDPMFRTASGEFSSMVRSLATAVAAIQGMADRVRRAANEMAEAAGSQADSAEESSRAADRLVASVDDLAKGAVSISELTGHVVSVSKKASVSAEMGREAALTTARALERISERVQEISGQARRLVELSTGINQFLGLIDDIADQTNLLALNATIEAARAGEEGRGFAVVADEVRKLAERAARATGDVRSLIDDVGRAIGATSVATTAGAEEVARGAQLADQAASALDRIFSAVAEMDESLQGIAEVTGRQRGAAGGSVSAVTTVSETNRQFSDTSGSVREEAEGLADLAEELRAAVGRFRLEAGEYGGDSTKPTPRDPLGPDEASAFRADPPLEEARP